MKTSVSSSSNAAMQIVKTGAIASLQTLGRIGVQEKGFSAAGAADEKAFLWANRLLGNSINPTQNRSPSHATLEILLGPFEAIFSSATSIAITGACQQFFINNKPCYAWREYPIAAGDHLRLPFPENGVVSYLAISGGFEGHPHSIESAACIREKTGKIFTPTTQDSAKTLRYKSVSPAERCSNTPTRFVPTRFIENYTDALVLDFIPGYQFDLLADDALQPFFNDDYHIANASDRMGYRLNGPAINHNLGSLPSEGIAFGSVQLPPDGQPIVLLKDRQTIGGYPKLGTITQLSAFSLSQRRPGQPVRFRETTLKKAQQALRDFYRFFNTPGY